MDFFLHIVHVHIWHLQFPFHVRILVMRITVEVVSAPRDIPVQSVHMDNSCPG